MNHHLQASLQTIAVILAVTASAVAHPEIPGPPQTRAVVLIDATIHPINGPSVEKGILVFDGGKITAVGRPVMTLPPNAEVIDLAGKHVYPSLFDAITDVGLVEINSIRATIDGQEVGQLNPNVRAITAVNPDSEIIPVTRSNGVLLALAAPYGGLISGRSGIIQLDGWTWEDMALKADAALHIQWPSYGSGRRRGGDEEESATPRGERAVEQLKQAFADARAYATARKADPNFPRDARWESLQDVLAGTLPVIIHADELRQITAAVAFAEREKLRLIIAGGFDAPQCAALLKKHNIPVIVGGTYRLPRRRGDSYDSAYALPAELHKAGLRYCISTHGRFGASNVRNLPYHASVAVAFGLSADEALKSITLHPAEILGVADRVGSLATGKDATLFVADGDILNTATQVTAAWVRGRQVDLNDRHKRLYHKYEEKYRQ